jgi:hypothetical protein
VTSTAYSGDFLARLNITNNQRRIIARSAQEFEARGDWVDFDTLAYESATSDSEFNVNEVFQLPSIIGGAWAAEKVNLTGLGVVLAGTAPQTASRMAQLALVCGERKLRLREDALISRSILVDEYGFAPEDALHAVDLVMMLPGVSGGGRLGEDWSLSIFRTALDYRDVHGVDDLRRILERQAEDRLRSYEASLASASVPASSWRDPAEWSTEPTGTAAEDEVQPRDPTKVFLVHGRDREATDAMWSFLQDLGLHPLDWWELVAATGQGSPFIGNVLEEALKIAPAIVVFMTPDDAVQLQPELVEPGDAPYELEALSQPRPNVLFEAGMAFGRHPAQTILVELGTLRPMSDLGGRHAVRLGTESTLRDLASRLAAAGCAVNTSGPTWLDVDRFASLKLHSRPPFVLRPKHRRHR